LNWTRSTTPLPSAAGACGAWLIPDELSRGRRDE
jgi:hypothetical protein